MRSDTDALRDSALDLDGTGNPEVNEIVEALANVKGALAETDLSRRHFGDIDAMSINNLPAAFDLDELGPLESASGTTRVRQHGGREAALRTCMAAE